MPETRYQGQGLPPDDNPENRFPYIASQELVDAVNTAMILERPLLVKGPPGCGKTRLAASIAHELGLELFEWYVKSTSRARDGLYTIDVLRRLQDAQLKDPKAQRLTPYISFGPLGRAFRKVTQSVVLIDEIDKADIDFPNDLLRELDEKKFTIEELTENDLTDEDRRQGVCRTYEAAVSPVIVVTSNDEKELPDAFLRRCLFHYIEFPDDAQLMSIVTTHIDELKVQQNLIEQAIARLRQVRDLQQMRKPPATSELIDWVRILQHWGIDVGRLEEAGTLTDLPFWRVLLKHHEDQIAMIRAAQGVT
jgi:MoxR-like ATPase